MTDTVTVIEAIRFRATTLPEGQKPIYQSLPTISPVPVYPTILPSNYLLSPISYLLCSCLSPTSPVPVYPTILLSYHPTNYYPTILLTNYPLYSRFHYILILLIAIVVYLIYLIGYYKVQEYGTDAFMESIRVAGKSAEERIGSKEFLASYIRTKAYETQVAKGTQNKKLPGEEVINIVTEEEVSSNADIDTRTAIAGIQSVAEDPTRGMSNPEKWWWMIETGIRERM